MRRDVLELMAEELTEKSAHPLASFLTWDEGAGQGRRKLNGMQAGRQWDIDREFRAWEKANRKELEQLANRQRVARFRRENREWLLAYRKAWRLAHLDREHEYDRRKRARVKKDPKRLAIMKARMARHQPRKNERVRERRLENPTWWQARLEQQKAWARANYSRIYKPEGKRRCSVCREPGHNVKRCPQALQSRSPP